MPCAGKAGPRKQTDPPSIPVADLFPSGVFPEGERQPYSQECVSWHLFSCVAVIYDLLCVNITTMMFLEYSQRWRETSEEKRELERLEFDTLNEVRQAAEVHRQAILPVPAHMLSQQITENRPSN